MCLCVYVCVGLLGDGYGGIFPKVPLEDGPPRLRVGPKKSRDLTCFEAAWTSYWDTGEVRRG